MFKEVSSEAAVIVDIFRDEKVLKYPATVVGGDHDSDVAFLAIQNKDVLPSVTLASELPPAKSPIFSIGCNGGNLPTTLNTTVVQLNRYEGPENIVTAIDPVQGRSGGGLFNRAGQLIGVCSGAFRKRKEGLYTGIGAVRKLMKQLKLDSLLDDAAPVFSADPTPAIAAADDPQANNPFAEATGREADFADDIASLMNTSDEPPIQTASADASLPDPFAASPVSAPAASGPSEITVIIDSKTPGQGKQVIVIPRPSPWLMQLLTGETSTATTTAAAPARSELSTTSTRRASRKVARTARLLPPAR